MDATSRRVRGGRELILSFTVPAKGCTGLGSMDTPFLPPEGSLTPRTRAVSRLPRLLAMSRAVWPLLSCTVKSAPAPSSIRTI
jgi:hypothetical protein